MRGVYSQSTKGSRHDSMPRNPAAGSTTPRSVASRHKAATSHVGSMLKCASVSRPLFVRYRSLLFAGYRSLSLTPSMLRQAYLSAWTSASTTRALLARVSATFKRRKSCSIHTHTHMYVLFTCIQRSNAASPGAYSRKSASPYFYSYQAAKERTFENVCARSPGGTFSNISVPLYFYYL